MEDVSVYNLKPINYSQDTADVVRSEVANELEMILSNGASVVLSVLYIKVYIMQLRHCSSPALGTMLRNMSTK